MGPLALAIALTSCPAPILDPVAAAPWTGPAPAVIAQDGAERLVPPPPDDERDDAADPTALPEGAVEHRVTIDERVTLRVVEQGEGRAVLLLTGGPGFAGATMAPWAAHLSKGARTILPDQRGTGGSTVDVTMTAFDLPSVVADLEAVREALDVAEWTLVGHSWGGILSMAYAAEHPRRVKALTLVDPGGLEPSFFVTYQTNIMARLDDEGRAALQGLRPRGTDLAAFGEMVRESNRIMAPGMVEVEQAVPALQALLAPGMFEPTVGLAMQPTLGQLDLTEAVGAYTGPVLVLQGEHDPIGRETAEAIVAAFDHATLEVLPGVGHWPDLEDPRTLFARLDRWLEETEVTTMLEAPGEASATGSGKPER